MSTQTVGQRKTLMDFGRKHRQDFIQHGIQTPAPDTYKERRDAAIEFLRSCGRYVLDRGSKPYVPDNGHTPAAMVPLRSRL